jgi:hypothetical protein
VQSVLCRANGDARSKRRERAIAAAAALAASWCGAASADPVPATINGIPQQIQPQAEEVGLGNFTLPTGTVSLLGGIGAPASGGSTGTGTSTSSAPLDTMLATSWGTSAQQSSEALGVNATALAATCVLESNCQNVGGSGSITGAFQMTSSTYQSSLNAALQADPSLAADIVPGLAGQSDPATQAIAASEYLKQAAQSLQNNGVSNPTVLDVRGYYNFGPSGAALATADADATMASVLTNTSAATLAANGITSGETVGQWRASVSSKISGAASAPVLI